MCGWKISFSIKKGDAVGIPFLPLLLPLLCCSNYSILALARNSSIAFLIDCCCRRCCSCALTCSNGGAFSSRVSSSLMTCQPNCDCTGTLVYSPFFRLSSALANSGTKLPGTAQPNEPPCAAEPVSLDFAASF